MASRGITVLDRCRGWTRVLRLGVPDRIHPRHYHDTKGSIRFCLTENPPRCNEVQVPPPVHDVACKRKSRSGTLLRSRRCLQDRARSFCNWSIYCSFTGRHALRNLACAIDTGKRKFHGYPGKAANHSTSMDAIEPSPTTPRTPSDNPRRFLHLSLESSKVLLPLYLPNRCTNGHFPKAQFSWD